MWTAPDYALVITSLTGLLALGVPPIVSAFDARRARRAARKDEVERQVFFVLDNYRRQRLERDKFMRTVAEALIRGEEPTGTVDDISVVGFQPAIPRLKALATLHQIDDAGFFAAVSAYLETSMPLFSHPDSSDEERKRTIAELLDVGGQRHKLEVEIETVTAAFLANIEARFG